jgi:hypothetical protein
MKTMSRLLSLFIVVSFASACGDDGDNAAKGKLTLQMQAVSSAALAAQGAALSLARDEGDCSATYQASNSQSGAADSVKVFVKKIVIDDYDADTGSSTAPITIFESSESSGAELELSSGKVDLSELLDYDAGLTALEPEAEGTGEAGAEEVVEGVVAEVEPKTYRRISLTLANRALIKGCIMADWAGEEGPNAETCVDGAAAEGLCDPLDSGIHTFCTQSAYDSTAVFADDANVPTSYYEGEGVSAQEIEVPLEWLDATTAMDLTSEVTYRFNTPETVVDEENQPTLTLAIDLNTMLSFEANTRTEGTNPFNSGVGTTPATYDKAFFYASRINNQMMAFLGEVGDIHGYSVNSCYFNNNDTSDARAVKSWMTVIFDAAGDIATGLVTPTDAAGYVLLKGDIHAATMATDGTFDLDICGGYDVTPGGTCHQLNNYLPLESVDQTGNLSKEDMTSGREADGTWDYTRKL